MRLRDVYPARGMFKPGEPARLVAEIEAEATASGSLRITIAHLTETVASWIESISLTPGTRAVTFGWPPPDIAPRGYGVEVELLDEVGRRQDAATTAFDVLPSWTTFPRYGYLTDFAPGRGDIPAVVASLARFHLNGLQFYDWQYRHDHLLPLEPDYIDPLGRRLSLPIVADGVRAAQAHGMAAMPYLAVYAASPEFWRAHPDWALYDAEHRPMSFGDGLLGLMNPAPGAPWTRHLLGECAAVLAALPFDGLHVDQYGDPKVASDAGGRPVDLPAAFVRFIAALKERHPQATVLFNAVGNWPIEALAASAQDFAYIEVWPPATAYRDLQETIAGARVRSGAKPVVIALYLPADRPTNIRLADALIFSCGGSRIELGEGERLLADPYFPKHQPLTPELRTTLRRYYDFAVRYGEWIGPAASDAPDIPVRAPDGILSVCRTAGDWCVVCLVNMTGLSGPRWDEPQPTPTPRTDVPIQVRTPWRAGPVWWATPDRGHPELQPAEWSGDGGDVRATLPFLDFWAILAFQRKPMGNQP